MEITYGGRRWRRGDHVKKSDLKVGMKIICGDEEHNCSGCWKVGGKLAVWDLLECTHDAVAPGIQKQPIDRRDYADNSCCCSDLHHLYEAIDLGPAEESLTATEARVDTSGAPTILTKPNNLPMSIKTILKNLMLSEIEKTLRAHSLEDQHGDMTQDARDLMCSELCEERWATRRTEIATRLKEEDDKSKK